MCRTLASSSCKYEKDTLAWEDFSSRFYTLVFRGGNLLVLGEFRGLAAMVWRCSIRKFDLIFGLVVELLCLLVFSPRLFSNYWCYCYRNAVIDLASFRFDLEHRAQNCLPPFVNPCGFSQLKESTLSLSDPLGYLSTRHL